MDCEEFCLVFSGLRNFHVQETQDIASKRRYSTWQECFCSIVYLFDVRSRVMIIRVITVVHSMTMNSGRSIHQDHK